jgi:carbon-monoxide dehydrogenase large subunit
MSLLTSRTRAARDGFGKPVRRVEDERLLTGRGCYSDDFNLPGQVYASFVRSPHAHARILGLDTAAALKVPGVIAVLIGADVVADGLKSIPHRPTPANPYEPQLSNGARGDCARRAASVAGSRLEPVRRLRHG